MFHGRVLKALLSLSTFTSLSAAAANYGAKAGEYIVRLKPSAERLQIQSLQNVLGAEVLQVVSNDLNIVLVQKSIIFAQSVCPVCRAKLYL